MKTNRYLTALLGIIALFAVGLGLFFTFSAEKGDGLEKTMERAGMGEGEPVLKAPLDYGDNYPTAFLAGIIGSITVFALAYASGKLLGRKRKKNVALKH